MTDWPDPKGEPYSPILERLCAADELKEPLATMKRCLQDELTSEEVDAALRKLNERGVVELSGSWVYLSRSAVKAALRAELGLP